ncbi:hypothetical protein [Aliagarivorans taiwanensis]|uniref:hypothetical protein n=1 Tax=Aliagarivorans taiwanensis TaxID=561966 RepID=UPI000426A787|nr:hypothetical protein [Aliagarivorans taiwanensis]
MTNFWLVLSALCRPSVLLLLLSFSASAQYAIVSATPSPPAQLSLTKAKLVFLGKSSSVKGIGRVRLIDFPSGNADRTAFYKAFLNKNEAEMNRIWTSLAFSGRGTPPEESSSEDYSAIREWLQQNPEGLGYLPLEHVGDLNVLLEVH